MPDYSLGDVARILKVSPRRLRYWRETRLVSSEASDERGASSDADAPADAERSGDSAERGDEGFGFRDLVVLRAIVSLVDKGIPLQRIRRNLEAVRDRLPELDDPAAALRLWDDASRRLVVRHDGRLEDAEGQLVLDFDALVPEAAGEAAVADLATFEAGLQDAAEREARALEWFERGCELDAESSRWSEAIEAYERAIELDAEYADAYCNLGAVRYNQGQRAEARRAFEACLGLEADHVEANFNLANVLEEDGEDDRALAHYRRALAADPLYPDLHINLALLYEKLGQGAPATDHWRRYLQLDPQGPWVEVARGKVDRSTDLG